MNPFDSKQGKRLLNEFQELTKPRKMGKLDKVTGIGPANKSNSIFVIYFPL